MSSNTIQNSLDKIIVKEVTSQIILKEFDQDDYEQAQNYALAMEKMGLDIELQAPSLPESLAIHLGANKEEIDVLKDMIIEEIESHDDCQCQ